MIPHLDVQFNLSEGLDQSVATSQHATFAAHCEELSEILTQCFNLLLRLIGLAPMLKVLMRAHIYITDLIYFLQAVHTVADHLYPFL